MMKFQVSGKISRNTFQTQKDLIFNLGGDVYKKDKNGRILIPTIKLMFHFVFTHIFHLFILSSFESK